MEYQHLAEPLAGAETRGRTEVIADLGGSEQIKLANQERALSIRSCAALAFLCASEDTVTSV